MCIPQKTMENSEKRYALYSEDYANIFFMLFIHIWTLKKL